MKQTFTTISLITVGASRRLKF